MTIDPVVRSIYAAETLQYVFARTLENKELPDDDRAKALRGVVNNLSTVARGLQESEKGRKTMRGVFDACLHDPALAAPQYESVTTALQTARAEFSL